MEEQEHELQNLSSALAAKERHETYTIAPLAGQSFDGHASADPGHQGGELRPARPMLSSLPGRVPGNSDSTRAALDKVDDKWQGTLSVLQNLQLQQDKQGAEIR